MNKQRKSRISLSLILLTTLLTPLKSENVKEIDSPFPLQTNGQTFIAFEIADADWLNYVDEMYDLHTNIIHKQTNIINNLQLTLSNKNEEIRLSKKIHTVEKKIDRTKETPFIIGGFVVSFGIGFGLAVALLK